MRILLGAVSVMLGCVDPLVSDAVNRSSLILPATAEVQDLLVHDPSRRLTLEANDGLPDDRAEIPLYSAFANGKPIRYWDFGPVSQTPIPLYLLVEPSDDPVFETPGGGFSPVGQPPIFDAIPGDAGYSPYWSVVLVPVNAHYAGEILASFAAIDEAQRIGLVGMPIPIPYARNCPVVLPEARLELADGGVRVPTIAYYKGFVIHYFDLNGASFDLAGGQIAVASVYTLRRSGGEPISEQVRGVDFTRDGDLLDTNDIFLVGRDSADYTGLVTAVDTIVAPDLATLDDAASSALTAASDLFLPTGAPDPDVVVALYPSSTVLNRPIASTVSAEP